MIPGTLSKKEAADALSVSSATLSNWEKVGYLRSFRVFDKVVYPELSIEKLRRDIADGKINRLRKRAHRGARGSALKETKIVPSVFFEDYSLQQRLWLLCSFYAARKLNIQTDLAFLAANEQSLYSDFPEVLKSEGYQGLSEEFQEWFDTVFIDAELITGAVESREFDFTDIDFPESPDVLGLLYHELRKEGERVASGAWFTPSWVARELLAQTNFSAGDLFLDPCCGTGSFLLEAAALSGSPEKIVGVDSDPIAVRLCRINLLLMFPGLHFSPPVYCFDFLFDDAARDELIEAHGIPECVATNPPWGAHWDRKKRAQLDRLFPEIRSGESASYFVATLLRLAGAQAVSRRIKKRVRGAFLLPAALAFVNTHQDLRKMLLEETQLHTITDYGRLFRSIYSNVFAFGFCISKKKKPQEKGMLLSRNKNVEPRSVRIERFNKNDHLIFDVHVSENQHRLLKNLDKNGIPFSRLTPVWILGMVTGNNKHFLSDESVEGTVPVVAGTDLVSFAVPQPGRYVHAGNYEKMQQIAPLEYYAKKPKILYSFITKKPKFSLDNKGFQHLNSVNSFFIEDLSDPCDNDGTWRRDEALKRSIIDGVGAMSYSYLLGLLNSSLFRFYFQGSYNSVKLLRSHIESFPLPQGSHFVGGVKLKRQIEDFAALLIADPSQIVAHARLDRAVYRLYGLGPSEILEIERFIR